MDAELGRSVLWVTAEEPSREKGGGSIRQAHLLRAVAASMPTDLLLVGHLQDEELRKSLRRVVELAPPPPWRPPRRHLHRRARELFVALAGRSTVDEVAERSSRRLLARHLRQLGQHDVVLVEHETMARLLPEDRHGRWILTLQNIESQRADQLEAVTVGRRQRWVVHRNARRARRLEQWAVGAYDIVVTVSEEDAAALPGPSVVVPNGVDLDQFRPSPLPAAHDLVMTASLNFPPNVQGAVWFCREVLPLVRDAVADVGLTIAGRCPLPEAAELGRLDGVRVVANPPDMMPYLAAGRVAVVPLRVGTGTRLKALEALACARPLVGTSIGLGGLGIVHGTHARVVDEPAAMARAIIELLLDDVAAQALAAAGRQHAEGFSWSAAGDRLLRAISGLPSVNGDGAP